MAKLRVVIIIARRFKVLFNAPLVCQLFNASENQGWLINHLCRRSLERAKQNAANKINGTVGNKGTTIPITPSNKLSKPTIRYKPRFITITFNQPQNKKPLLNEWFITLKHIVA